MSDVALAATKPRLARNAKADPDWLYQQYVDLGPQRTYDLLADRTGYGRRTIARLGTKHKWQEHIQQEMAVETQRLKESVAVEREKVRKELVSIARGAMTSAIKRKLVPVLGEDGKQAVDEKGQPIMREQLAVAVEIKSGRDLAELGRFLMELHGETQKHEVSGPDGGAIPVAIMNTLDGIVDAINETVEDPDVRNRLHALIASRLAKPVPGASS